MSILPEIDVGPGVHAQIQQLRNQSFPDYAVPRSYFKQLPHYRVLHFVEQALVATMGLDCRVMMVSKQVVKVLGIIDLCVDEDFRGQGIAAKMLAEVSSYATQRDVDFLLLMADRPEYYEKHGFKRVECVGHWLKIHEHQNFGTASEFVYDLMVKPVSSMSWPEGDVDWLGYMY